MHVSGCTNKTLCCSNMDGWFEVSVDFSCCRVSELVKSRGSSCSFSPSPELWMHSRHICQPNPVQNLFLFALLQQTNWTKPLHKRPWKPVFPAGFFFWVTRKLFCLKVLIIVQDRYSLFCYFSDFLSPFSNQGLVMSCAVFAHIATSERLSVKSG